MKIDQPFSTGAAEGARSPDAQSTVFRIPNMDCRNEEAAIRARLGNVAEVRALSFDLPQRRLTVEHGLETPQPLLDALIGIGMKAELEARPAAPAPSSCGSSCSSSCKSSQPAPVPAPSADVFTIPNMEGSPQKTENKAR